MRKLKGLYLLDTLWFDRIYDTTARQTIGRHVDMIAPQQTRQSIANNRSLLEHVDVIFSGWWSPQLDETFLDAAPNLKAFFYGAGTTGYCVTDAVWERGIVVTTANAANAVPVAEYTLAAILFSLKHAWPLARQTREQRSFLESYRNNSPGCYDSTVGLISVGLIARALLKLLACFDLRVIVYDPMLTDEEAECLGVQKVSLRELLRKSDVVSLHTPSLAETQGMITGEHLSLMKHGSTFINTARGEIVRQDELIEVARARPDLQFILDVTTPEPPPADSALFDLPNVMLTPHIAGSIGNECRRMGNLMVEELERYVTGSPLHWAISREAAHHSSHRPTVTVKAVKKLEHTGALKAVVNHC